MCKLIWRVAISLNRMYPPNHSRDMLYMILKTAKYYKRLQEAELVGCLTWTQSPDDNGNGCASSYHICTNLESSLVSLFSLMRPSLHNLEN